MVAFRYLSSLLPQQQMIWSVTIVIRNELIKSLLCPPTIYSVTERLLDNNLAGCHEKMWPQPDWHWGVRYHQQDSWRHRQSYFWRDARTVFLVWVLIINFRISTTSWRRGLEIQIRRPDTRWIQLLCYLACGCGLVLNLTWLVFLGMFPSVQ